MTEDLTWPSGGPGTSEHMAGKPVSVGTYNKGCRCEDCKLVKRNDRLKRLGREPDSQPGRPRVNPDRPPGWCWVDNSGLTQVVRCERCDKQWGTWVLDPEQAAEFARLHRELHREDPPFDWSKWSEQQLIKNPGGRPRGEDGSCLEWGCGGDYFAKGMCRKHYMRAYRKRAA